MANKVYYNPETPDVFKDSGDKDLTLINLASGAARISIRVDRGANAQPGIVSIRGSFQFETAPVIGQVVYIHLSTSDGTNPDGEEGVVDAALGTLGSLKNMTMVLPVKVTSTDADHVMTASQHNIVLNTRYYSIVVENATDDNLRNDANTSSVTVTAKPPEIQT